MGTKQTKSDLPQGTLDLLILKIVALGPVHGYSIAQRLQQVSRDVVQVPQGSLYPALHRLENRGLLAAEWTETQTGREAKFYRLTRKGTAQLEMETASWRRLTGAVGVDPPDDGRCGMTWWSRLWRRRHAWKPSSKRSCAFTRIRTSPISWRAGSIRTRRGGRRGWRSAAPSR